MPWWHASAVRRGQSTISRSVRSRGWHTSLQRFVLAHDRITCHSGDSCIGALLRVWVHRVCQGHCSVSVPLCSGRTGAQHKSGKGQWCKGAVILDIIANNNIDQKVVEISSLQHYALVENSIDHSIFLLKAYTMMFSYHQVKERPKLLLAMTGLNHAEFAELLPHFQSALAQYVQHNYSDRDNRQRQYGGR